jgi:hypothetical protein
MNGPIEEEGEAMRTSNLRRLALGLAATVALAGSLGLRPPALAEREGSVADWAAVRSIVAGIKGVATTPPAHLVTTHFTDGMLMGNGDIGVAAGGTTSTERFLFGKSNLWGSTLNPGRVRAATVTSEKGGTLRLADPFAGGEVHVARVGGDEGDGRSVRFTLTGGVISFRTSPGATYRITNEV